MRNTSGLRRGGGRVKGVPNRTTHEIKQFAVRFLGSDAYVENAKHRVIQGKAPHLEVLWHHYAYGKPKETVHLQSEIPAFVLRLEKDADHP